MLIFSSSQKIKENDTSDWQQQQKTKYLSIPSAGEAMKQQELP